MTTSMESPDCGCSDYRTSRRTVLKGLGGAVVTSMVGSVFTSTAYGATTDGNVLVVLSLRGGCDGLSLVVPHGDAGYAAARPRIAVPTGSLLAKDAMFGLHPALAPLVPMWTAGRFGAVQAVGLPQPNRSHFAAMEAVEDADPGSSARVGWLNRMVGVVGDDDPVDAVQLGSPLLPTALVGPAPALALDTVRSAKLPGADTAAEEAAVRASLSALWSGQRGSMATAVSRTLQTTTTLAPVASAASGPQNGATYPDVDLGRALKDTAALIRAGVGVQTVTVDHGSWDMHTDLGTIGSGNMRYMLNELASSLAAFFTDLGALGDKVTVVTMSEFGRTVRENGNSGTDHGYGNAMLMLGAGVRGGQVHGTWPGLGSGSLVDGDLAVTNDYRCVLAEVVASRFPTANLSTVFPGLQRTTIGVMA
jgi:uncharacterized protein (DUF1501 family)